LNTIKGSTYRFCHIYKTVGIKNKNPRFHRNLDDFLTERKSHYLKRILTSKDAVYKKAHENAVEYVNKIVEWGLIEK